MNHHRLAGFRTKQGAFLETVLTQGVAALLAQDLVSRERVARDGGDIERAQRSLHEIAGSWMLRTTATARHGRFLRAALADRPDVPFERVQSVAPHQAALLRERLTEAWDYDKAAAKRAGDNVDHHALDAYVLALGTATGFFARLAMAERFSQDTEECLADTVAAADPTFRTLRRFDLDLLPVPGAEEQTVGFGVMGGQSARGDAEAGTGVRLMKFLCGSNIRAIRVFAGEKDNYWVLQCLA